MNSLQVSRSNCNHSRLFNRAVPPPECGEAEWRCGDGLCVSASAECDGVEDCSDASDEENCPGLIFVFNGYKK